MDPEKFREQANQMDEYEQRQEFAALHGDGAPQPTLLEMLIRLGTPLMDAETANKEVVRLTVANIRLQARIDEMREKP